MLIFSLNVREIKDSFPQIYGKYLQECATVRVFEKFQIDFRVEYFERHSLALNVELPIHPIVLATDRFVSFVF